MSKEALKLALEALEDLGMKHYENTGEVLYKETFTAIKVALEAEDGWTPERIAGMARLKEAQDKKLAQQEPVAWIWEKEDGYTSIETHSLNHEDMKNVGVKSMKPLYAKPQFIGLSEDEILSISADCAATHQHTDIHFARAIEAKLRSKNHEI